MGNLHYKRIFGKHLPKIPNEKSIQRCPEKKASKSCIWLPNNRQNNVKTQKSQDKNCLEIIKTSFQNIYCQKKTPKKDGGKINLSSNYGKRWATCYQNDKMYQNIKILQKVYQTQKICHFIKYSALEKFREKNY